MTKRALPSYCYLHRRKSGDYIEFRRRGVSVMMREAPGSPEFAIAYAKLLNGVKPMPVGRDFNALILHYKRSPRYLKLAPRTKADYGKIMEWVRDAIGPLPVARMQKKDVIRARDENAETVRFANYIVQVLSVLFEYSTELGWREDNPAKGIHMIKSGRDARQPWPPDMIEAYRAKATGRALLIFELCLGTGQRIADVLRMRWNDLQDGGVNVRQGKTGARLWIPLTGPLRAALDATPKRGLAIVAQANGRPTSYRGAADLVMGVRRVIGAEAYDIHALRHTAVAALAEVGCTDEQIMSVTGHSSASMVSLYAGGSRQKARATEAQGKRK